MEQMKQILIIALISFYIIAQQPILISEQNINNNDLPISFSWTNINGTDYTTPIKDQSPAPTCEAYALCAAIETLMQYQTETLFQPDLSEAHLYFFAGGKIGRASCRERV